MAGQINISHTPQAELKGLEDIGLDAKALLAKPCSMQIVLLPFGEKDEPTLYKGKLSHVLWHALGASNFGKDRKVVCSIQAVSEIVSQNRR